MPAVRHEIVTVKGEVTAWRSLTGDGWGVGQMRTVDGLVPFTGKLLARVGDTVELQGTWTEHDRYGRQFKVRTCTVARPESSEGIVAWLASTLPSVGPGRAQALVDRFGPGLWDVIEQRPHELAKVDGITAARIEEICHAYYEHRAERDHMITLRGWGLTDNQIARCREVWGSPAVIVEHVHANPYELCQYVYGFGFKRADLVAKRAGLPHDAPERIVAGIEHTLEQAAGGGDCFMWGKALQREAAKLLDVAPELVAAGIRAALGDRRIAKHQARYYPRRLDEAEESCALRLRAMLARVRSAEVIDLASRRQAKG